MTPALYTLLTLASIAAGPRPLAPPQQQAEGVQVRQEVGVVTGHAAYYQRPGLMQEVAANRGMSIPRGYIPVSVPSCKHIGQRLLVSIKGGPYLNAIQVDCSQYRDYQRHIRIGLVVEVPYEVARSYGFLRAGKAPAKVWYYDRANAND